MKIAPRNSQLPNSRETRTVCLPCQPRPAASASGFSITGAVSTNTFTSDPLLPGKHPSCFFQLALDDVVVVAIARIDRDRRPILQRQGGERVGRRRIVQPEKDDAPHLGPERLRGGAARPRYRTSIPSSRDSSRSAMPAGARGPEAWRRAGQRARRRSRAPLRGRQTPL